MVLASLFFFNLKTIKEMARKISRKGLIKKLDTIFSVYIRRKDAVNDMATCVTCGKVDFWKNQQNGHFMSRKHYATRWDEDNCGVQCAGCNVFRWGEQYKFSLYLGAEKSEEMLNKSRQVAKFSDDDLKEMIEYYTEKVNNL